MVDKFNHMHTKKAQDKKLNNLNYIQGLTLIELLISILIVAILALIAWPAYLGFSAKARQTEARNVLGIVNRSQLGFYQENSRFADSISELIFGIRVVSDNYSYTNVYSGGTPGLTENTAIPYATYLFANPQDPLAVKNYAGGVVLYVNNGVVTLKSIVCEEQSTAANITLEVIDGSGSFSTGGMQLNPDAITDADAVRCDGTHYKTVLTDR
ncbi:type IV pilin-like G/H family protein [Picosynechococcus sp. PCC 7117]|uniref:type IV pilin-like G/H family protein n=1 Tax=Picosynechococcus sp. PCC 7117 TaxID=195498 RepID=UPI000810D382|nr:type IV pilin-like G/H family protein [Picosynechococcus sp. PCC 7117]ANV88528.1 hypothetical protein AWQ22_14275 [Picosynechococcus sp. PCC 7117]